MKATSIGYDFKKSIERIGKILNADNNSFAETDAISDSRMLTYENGFYVNLTAVFVNIRDISSIAGEHRRLVLAKIHRSFISEMVALMNGYNKTKEINIHCDSVWCVCDTQYKQDMDEVFSLVAKICSLADILNYKLSEDLKVSYKIGVGMDYGRALMIKAGYDGSEINDVVWVGDVVNRACHLCEEAGSGLFDKRIFLSNIVYDNLNEDNKRLCIKDNERDIYQANIVNENMHDWLTKQNS